MTNETTRNADTAAIALAFTAQEESSALESTVAWTVHVISQVCGWDGTPIKGGKKTAIKMARERYGYRVDANGESILDAKGNRAKRTAVFNRLALVDKVIAYALEHEKDWIATIHDAAVNPESEPEARDQAVAECVEQFANRLASVAKGNTIDALKFYLETGTAKADVVEDAAEALAEGDTPQSEGEAETAQPEGEAPDFDTIYGMLVAIGDTVSGPQWQKLAELARDHLITDAEREMEEAA